MATSGHVATTPYQFSVYKTGHSVAVDSATRVTTTLTVTATAHGFADGDTVTLAGFDQANYNVSKTITVVDEDTFTVAVTDAGASPATGAATATGHHQAVFNSAVLEDDKQLTLPIGAGENWVVDFTVFYQNTDDTTDGMSVSVTAPAGATGFFHTISDELVAAKAIAFATGVALGSDSLDLTAKVRKIRAHVQNGSTAGNVTLQFAQTTGAPATQAVVLAGSYLTATQQWTTLVV